MPSAEQRWRENWRAVAAPGAVRVSLKALSSRAATEPRLAAVAPGTPIVLSASAPAAGRRCDAFAARAGIEVERRYLAFPSAEAPGYLVEDARGPIRFFLERVLVPPPRPGLTLALAAALRILRGIVPWWAIRLVAPGRVVVGRSK
jgi:hypothetical protein